MLAAPTTSTATTFTLFPVFIHLFVFFFFWKIIQLALFCGNDAKKGRWDRPGPGSACGGLWTTGLQDRLVSTMAAMISSISTDSGLRKLGTNAKKTRSGFKPSTLTPPPRSRFFSPSSLPVWSLPGSSPVAPASLWLLHKGFLGGVLDFCCRHAHLGLLPVRERCCHGDASLWSLWAHRQIAASWSWLYSCHDVRWCLQTRRRRWLKVIDSAPSGRGGMGVAGNFDCFHQ